MTPALLVPIATLNSAAAAWAGMLLGESLSKRYEAHADGPQPVVFARWPFPIAGASIGLAASLLDPDPLHLVLVGIVLVALAACTASDLRCGMLPDVCTLGPLLALVAIAVFRRDWASPLGAALAAVPFAAAALVSRGRGMGWGDVKLAALGGALLGIEAAALAFMLAGGTAYLVARLTTGVRRPIAFGPYLAVSIAAASALAGGF